MAKFGTSPTTGYYPTNLERLEWSLTAVCMEFPGESLNRHLLQGPDQTNNVIGELCQFRQEPIALMCDTEGMFHQVHASV